ncbi:alpha/beta hydrolase family protein [Actinomadura madurae]|uniref:alpha/beta hydrolase family protein n=1 Tax=Actinomadura madurae TaxID=1993 RepID=UPI0020D1F657|nr:alpha/beta hydrolase [Actinomadura madurae]MCP9977116.1 alpha/beta hydrolase [Actinomadura madurae]
MGGIVREFVGLPSPLAGRAGAGGHPCQGVYHRPAGAPPRTAFIATHYNVDFSEHYLAEHLAARGYGFLGWNTRFRGDEAHFLLDHALAEIGTGVRWLRERAGAERIVLLGNSGGGSLMAAYQSQAVRPSVTPVAGMRPVPAIEDLPAGDLFIALAAHAAAPRSSPRGWTRRWPTRPTPCRPTRPSTRSTPRTGRPTARGSRPATAPPSAPATSASPTGSSPAWTP